MLRGNRLLFVALGLVAAITVVIGWWTLPISPTTQQFRYDSPRNENYRPGGGECEPTSLARIVDAKVGLHKASDCQKEAEEYRQASDDLIQQTRAANAAQAQADIASQQLWTGWLQTLGGFLTLAAAAGAAVYARDAARHTRHANEITHEAQRPWIDISVEVTEFKVEKGGVRFSFAVAFTNIGKTVAENLWVKTASKFCGEDQGAVADELFKQWRDEPGKNLFTLMPGETVRNWGVHDATLDHLPWYGSDADRSVMLIVCSAAHYDIPSKPQKGITERTFLVAQRNTNPIKQLQIKRSRIESIAADNIVYNRTSPSRTG